MEKKHKIFGIGIGRTGTKSLNEALRILGYKCIHWSPDKATKREVISGTKVSRMVEKRDVIIDTVLPILHYREYAKRFPDAKFILTTRNEQGWLKSIKKHTMGIRINNSENFSAELYGSLILKGWDFGKERDKELLKLFRKYNKEVETFFKDSPSRLLKIDITSGEGWEKLCKFLKKPIPKIKFPNKRNPKNYSNFYNAHFKRDTLALLTMILPRMEINHLEQWIKYHYNLGVRHIWIVHDKPLIGDIALSQTGGRVWKKKPQSNFNLHLSDKSSVLEIEKIIEKCEIDLPYINIRFISINEISKSPDKDIAKRQVESANIISSIMEGVVDWVGLIDVDEILPKNIIKRLDTINKDDPKISTIRMARQRLMGNRFKNGKPLNYNEIDESWGVIPDPNLKYMGNGKSFVKPCLGYWDSPHRAYTVKTKKDMISSDINFMHFRGIDVSQKAIDLGWDKVYLWAREHRNKRKYWKHKKSFDEML